jgi:PAS domain S-box-containing protein
MKTSYGRFSVIVGFLLLLLLLAANAFVTRRELAVQVGNQSWLAHSHQILFELSQTESLIKDAETGQRGFLYTEELKYLQDYQRAISQVDPHIDRLAQLTIDNPTQQARVPVFRTLSHAKLDELAETISLYQSGNPDKARALVKSDKGLFLMNDMRKLVGEMVQEESSLAVHRLAIYQRSIRVTIACIYLASLIAALGLILLACYILRERELRESYARQMEAREEWFRVTLTSLGDAVMATDESGRVTFLNPIAEQLMGVTLESVKGKPIQDVFPIFNESTHLPVENPVKKVMELGRIVGLANHTVLQSSDGTLIPIEDSAAPIRDGHGKLVGVVLVFRDATHDRKSQELLRKTEKLAAAARLAATVAHEINNPLEAIGNLIFIAKGTPGMPATAAEQLTQAEQELERVSHITRQTLGFYRESKVPDQIEIAALVESVFKIYKNKLSTKNITVVRNFGECPPIRGLSGELKQVVANLISNAADAVSEDGTIGVNLACIENHAGKAIQLSIEDNGTGISQQDLDRVFEPFFTTKKDVGTGLGLWVTKEIIERHGGSIHVHSRNDNGSSGTVFCVLLPLDAEWQIHS